MWLNLPENTICNISYTFVLFSPINNWYFQRIILSTVAHNQVKDKHTVSSNHNKYVYMHVCVCVCMYVRSSVIALLIWPIHDQYAQQSVVEQGVCKWVYPHAAGSMHQQSRHVPGETQLHGLSFQCLSPTQKKSTNSISFNYKFSASYFFWILSCPQGTIPKYREVWVKTKTKMGMAKTFVCLGGRIHRASAIHTFVQTSIAVSL